MAEGTVYVIQSGELYKIGRTRNLTQRLKDLQTGYPYEIVICYQLTTAHAVAFERHLHWQFASQRLLGEWFMLSEDDLNWIRGITAWSPPKPQPVPPRPVSAYTVASLFAAHGIGSMRELRRRTGLSKQYAWSLWHGRLNLGGILLRRLVAQLGIPMADLLALPRPIPPAARRPGRPRTTPRTAESLSGGAT